MGMREREPVTELKVLENEAKLCRATAKLALCTARDMKDGQSSTATEDLIKVQGTKRAGN